MRDDALPALLGAREDAVADAERTALALGFDDADFGDGYAIGLPLFGHGIIG